MAKDIYHDAVRWALEKEGWTIPPKNIISLLGTLPFRLIYSAYRLQSRRRNYRKMDKVIQYQKIITSLIEELAAHSYANAPGIERQVVTDPIHHHYQLINVGWHRGRFAYSPLLHFDIRDGQSPCVNEHGGQAPL